MPTPITGQGISAPPKVDATLSNTSKNAVQNQAVTNALAGAYDATATYAVGDLRIYDGILYECTTAITTAEAWDAAHWKTSNFGDDVADLKRQINELEDTVSTTQIVNTASGEIASFDDGADGQPIKKLVVNIEPKQDLHGYDSPWPAGGGKNIIDVFETPRFNCTLSQDGLTLTSSVVTYETNYNFMGAFTRNHFHILAGEKIYVSFDVRLIGGSAQTLNFQLTNQSVAIAAVRYGFVPTTSWQRITAEVQIIQSLTEADVYGIYCQGVNLSECQVQIANFKISRTADYVWSPYENICPISGWTGVSVWDDPKRGGTIEWEQQFEALSSTDWIYTNTSGTTTFSDGECAYTEVTPGVSYSDGFMHKTSKMFGVYGHKYFVSIEAKSDNTSISIGGDICNNGVNFSGTLSTTYKLFSAMVTSRGNQVAYFCTRGGSAAGDVIYFRNPMLVDLTELFGSGNEPSTVEEFRALFYKDYYAYSASPVTTCVSAVNGDPYRHHSVTWEDEVFGGEVDVVSGEMPVTWIKLVFDGSSDEAWTTPSDANPTYYAIWNNPASIGNTDLTQRSNWLQAGGGTYSPFGRFRAQSNGAIAVGNLDGGTAGAYHFATVSDFKAYLASNPLEICYRVANPTETTITPTPVSTLEGENNIWSNGDSVEVDYCADTKLYIEKLTQPTEDDMIADHAISAGTFFQLGNTLYLATSQIAAGATITPGTNATRLSLADALNQINS